MYPTHRARPRPGFTLIELLVVIAIIAIIIGMTTPALIKVLGLGPQAQTHAEISTMSNAIAQWEKDMGTPMPSYLRLRENVLEYPAAAQTDPVDAASMKVLEKMFGKTLIGNNTWVDWNHDGAQAKAGTYTDLQGQECLVFCLGGRVERGASGSTTVFACRGFSTSFNPMSNTGTSKGPWFQFPGNRLQPSATAAGFLVFNDHYGAPYAFFSTDGGTKNGTYNAADCKALGAVPYYSATPQAGKPILWYQPKGFQIISAGSDNAFGTDQLFPAAGVPFGPAADNLSNFSIKTFRAGAQ